MEKNKYLSETFSENPEKDNGISGMICETPSAKI